MKKKVFKGFTLIELLATILILGIIALITTIVVGGIIKDSKKSGVTLSVKSYIATINDNILSAKLRDESINDGTYKILANGNLCIGTYSNSQCVGEVLDLNIDRGIPTSGEVVITDRKVTKVLNASINGETISYDAVKNKEIISEAVLISNFEAIRYINSIKINFNAVNANSYTCEYGLTENYGSEGIVNAAKTECIINDLTPGTLYYYKLTVSGSGNKSDSKKGAIVTLPLKVNPTIALSPNGFSSTKTATIQYSDGDENARIIDPKYYFYTTSTGTSDIQVVACGTDFEPQTCGVLKTSTLKANTWYKLDDTDDIITITYLLNSTLIAKTNENNITVGSNQSLITTIDNSKPTIIVNNIKYGQSANIQLYDNQSGVSYFAVTSDTNIPSTTSSTTGNSLNTWYPTNEADPTARFTKEFPGLDAGVYYAWAKDELGNYESSRFVVDKANDVITIASVTKTYDKQNFVPNITTLSGLTTSNTYYSDSACTTQVQNPTNSGEYYVIATTSGNNNYKAETSACVKVAQIDKITIASSTTCEASKIYDGTRTATCTIGISNKIVGDNVDVSAGACNYNNANVGTNKTITCTSLALSGTDSSNYQFSGTSTTTKGNIYNATLAFNANGGTISGTTPRYVRKGQTGFFTGITNSTLGASPVGVKTGYTFDGWYTGDTKVIDPTVTFNGTKVAATASDTHKGIVYLDPTDLSRTCTAALSDANLNGNNTPTGINSGCMKFYIYDDEGSTYKMILDHNTSGNVAWNSDGTTTTMNEVATRLYADTLGWVGNPRLISADEIAQITGIATAVGFDETDSTSQWFYFDGSGSTYAAWHTQVATSQGASNYTWLFDYTYQCEQYGCNVEDNNGYPYPTMNSSNTNQAYGYWTSSVIASDTTKAWNGFRGGYLGGSVLNNKGFGVRPVITIPKSIIDGTNPIQASVANWTDSSSKWLLTANAELTARYSVNKYKATFYSDLVTNGDFSDTTGTGWQTKVNGSYGVDATVKNGTMNAMRITTDVNDWSGIMTTYQINYKPNTTYRISFKAYRDSSSSFGDQTRALRVYLSEHKSDSSVLNYYVATVNPSDLPDKTWKEFSRTFTTTSSLGEYFYNLCLDFNKEAGRTNIWVSDVKVEEITERYLDYDAQLGALPTTTRTGYTSGGYYTARNGSGTQISASTRMGAANVSYYEKWIANPYTVVFNANGGSGSMANQSIQYNTNQALNSNAYTREGFTFAGWTTALNYTELVNDPTEYNSSGQFNIKQYTINGPFNSGDVYQLDFDAKGSGTLTTYFYGEDNYLDVQEVINSDGWRLNTSTPFRDGNNNINLTSSYKHYTVQFTLGSSGDPTVTKYILFRTLNYNSVSFKNIVFKRVGNEVYDPNVRSGDATSLATGYVGIAQYTVPGPFSPGETYEVEFEAKGSGRLTTYFYGASNYLQIANTTNSDGWNNSYTDGYNDIVLTNNYTHYVVRFTLGSIGSTTVEKYLLFRVFAGYKADVKNVKMKKVATYANGATVRNLTVPGRTVNLYAMWEPNYTRVDFDANGGTLNGTSPVYVNFGDNNVYADPIGNTYAQVPTVSKNGSVFQGWYTNANAMDLGYSINKSAGNARINFANEHGANGWAMTSADQGTHVQAKVSVTDANITTQPAIQFNDVVVSPVHVDHVGNTWTFYIDLDISAQMLDNSRYPYDTTYRFIDIDNAGVSSSTQVTVDTLVKGGKKYYDESGNSTFFMDIRQKTTLYAKFVDTTGPTYTGVEVKNVTSTGYDVYVYGVTDGSGVNRVQFPTWTYYNGQDDIQANWQTSSAATGTKQSDGTTWVYRVNTTDHNNEAGVYFTHIYLYDTLGNSTVLAANETRYPATNGNKGAVTVPTVTATFNANGGNTPNPTSITKAYNNALGTLPSVSRTGYTFDGWYTAASGGTQISSSTVMPATAPEYFAHWTIKTHTVTCEDYFVDASKNRKVKLGSGTKTYNYGATASGADWGTTTSMSTYYSYYVYKEATSGTVPDNDNLVVYRYFWGWTDLNIYYAGGTTQNGATVSFKVGNGSWADVTNESNTTQPWGTTYYLKNIRPVNSTTEEFSSVSNLTWDSTNQYYYYAPTSAGTNMNVYMKYKTFAITLDRQDGSGGTATIYEKYNTGYYTNNTATTQMTTGANAISVPSRTGYTFGGYYTGTNGSGTQYINASGYLTSSASATAFTAAGSLYAKWTVVPYTISYNLNGGTVENANPTSYNINSGTITLTNPTRPGYTFVGWSGTGLSGSSNTSVTIPAGSTGNRSYTANWSLINYSISYDLKGGDATNPTSYNVTSNAFTLTNPTKTGFTFTGWTGSNGSTKQTTVTIPKGSTGNKSYTANWDKYNVTYELNRGTVTFASNQAVNTGFIIDYSKDFTLRARVNIPSNSTGRHMIFSNYYAMGTKQDFSIEFNADNKLRVWMNYDGVEGHSYTVFNNTVSKGVDIDVIFTWTAATKSYKFKTVGTNSNHEVSGTNANMTGIASYPLMIGTKDHRTNASSYTSITVKSASFTTTYTADSTLSTLPAPANNTSENYVFHGWFQYSDGTGTIASSSTVVNNDLTYYGHWTNEALWMSEPTISKSLVTGTGTTQTTGYEAGTTFTFTCYGASGHYPTSLQVKYNGTVTSTKTNNSSTTYTLSNTYTVTDYASSASVTATCTDNTGKTVNASGVTRPVYRKFRLYHNLNGATSLSGGGGTYLNTNQYLLGNSTAEGGGSPITLYNINRNRIGSEVATLGWNSSSTATSKIWSKGESVNIYYGSGTQTTGKVYANSNYNAERTIYAISYDTIPSPAMQNSNNGYFPTTGTSCGTGCGTQPSQTQTLSNNKIRVYNTRRYVLSSTLSTDPAIICAQQHAIYYHHAETGEKHRLDYTFVADGFDAGRLGTYIAGYVKGIMIPLNNYSSTGWSCELIQ